MEAEGFVVDTSNNPDQILITFKSDHYDIIIIDIRMPTMTGFELFDELRKLDKTVTKEKVCFMMDFEDYYKSLKEQFNLDVDCFIQNL